MIPPCKRHELAGMRGFCICPPNDLKPHCYIEAGGQVCGECLTCGNVREAKVHQIGVDVDELILWCDRPYGCGVGPVTDEERARKPELYEHVEYLLGYAGCAGIQLSIDDSNGDHERYYFLPKSESDARLREAATDSRV